MLVGAHMSIAGGVYNAITRGQGCGCDTIQIFSKSNNQWRAKELTDEDIGKYRELKRATGISPVVIHDSYLINLGASDEGLYKKSLEAFYIEMQRAEALDVPYLVMHPGAHVGAGEQVGLKRIAQGINSLHDRTKGFKTMITLETTAGQGSQMGYRFEHIAKLMEMIKEPDRIGVCLDTCHIFAAGYDIRTESVYKKTMKELNDTVGIKKIKVIHVNDCKKGLGCRVDRHEHIGQGGIGLEAFRLLMNDDRFEKIPKILETPKKKDGDDYDMINLATLRGLVGKKKAV